MYTLWYCYTSLYVRDTINPRSNKAFLQRENLELIMQKWFPFPRYLSPSYHLPWNCFVPRETSVLSAEQSESVSPSLRPIDPKTLVVVSHDSPMEGEWFHPGDGPSGETHPEKGRWPIGPKDDHVFAHQAQSSQALDQPSYLGIGRCPPRVWITQWPNEGNPRSHWLHWFEWRKPPSSDHGWAAHWRLPQLHLQERLGQIGRSTQEHCPYHEHSCHATQKHGVHFHERTHQKASHVSHPVPPGPQRWWPTTRARKQEEIVRWIHRCLCQGNSRRHGRIVVLSCQPKWVGEPMAFPSVWPRWCTCFVCHWSWLEQQSY